MSTSDRDILSPPIQVIGEKRYRVNVIRADYNWGNKPAPTSMGYQEEDLFGDDDDDAYEVEDHGSYFKSCFHVPRAFYGGLIGQKGMTKKRIESETKTEIIVPGVRSTGESLVSVKGSSRKNVCSAIRRIELVVESLRKKTKPTHFVCVPACTDELKKAFNEFKQSVLAEQFPSIDESLFISTEKIHITLATCTLLDMEERVKASQIFMDCKVFIANKPPIDVIVRDLEIMNDDASAVSVLYARIESPALQELADKILRKFKEARLNNEDRGDRSKLHMTIMNGRYREQVSSTDFRTFDARHLLKKYSGYNFGKFQIKEIHLSQMHTTGENGFYSATGILTV